MKRRALFAGTAFLLTAPLWPAARLAAQTLRRDPFTLGVASGCPAASSMVLWTRLYDTGVLSGLPDASIEVRWELARDREFRQVVQQGMVTAQPRMGFSVHVEPEGLDPQRDYWYRFHSGVFTSAIGRTRTLPLREAKPERLHFAFASCQHYETGYFAAYRQMAAENLDLIMFLGDYIYEGGSRAISAGANNTQVRPRAHNGKGPALTLADYRERYAHYKLDADLQTAHASAPWIMTWDDHEVHNDYANDQAEDLMPNFLGRRSAAYQAYFENMPLRKSMLPRAHEALIYGNVDFGNLARFHVVDTRQYRGAQPCPKPMRGGSNTVTDAQCPERLDPARTKLGSTQESWLAESFKTSGAQWNVLAQTTVLSPWGRPLKDGMTWWTDGWDGYPAARSRLIDSISTSGATNSLVIGGDTHTSHVADLKRDFANRNSPAVASEFCGTSISSTSFWTKERIEHALPANPHMKMVRGDERGYVVMEITAQRTTTRFRTLDDATKVDAKIATQATWVVEAGRPGATAA